MTSADVIVSAAAVDGVCGHRSTAGAKVKLKSPTIQMSVRSLQKGPKTPVQKAARVAWPVLGQYVFTRVRLWPAHWMCRACRRPDR